MNLFASHTFLDVIARVYFPSRPWSIHDHVIEGKVFRLLSIDGRGPLTTHPFLDMHEPLAAQPSAPTASVVRWLPKVSHGMTALEEFRESPAWNRVSAAPTVVWQAFPTWNAYLDLLRRRHVVRDDQRRRRRLCELVGPLTFRSDDAGADVLPTALRWKSSRLRQLTGSDLFACPQHRQFFLELRARGVLRASTLRAGARLLAAWLGAVFDGRTYGWIFAFDPDPQLARYSVGRQLLYPMLEESYRAGHREFDFSVGCEAYKLFFATHVRVVSPFGALPIRRRIAATVRERLRHAPAVYDRMKAVRLALQREMFRVRDTLSYPRRTDHAT